jgi:imidazolonepropionase-like amidohydrolase
VKIVFSTDGPLQKNDPWREFVALVARGMTPVQAIQSATIRAAELLEVGLRQLPPPGRAFHLAFLNISRLHW